MKGFVDDKLRALLRIEVSSKNSVPRQEIAVWVDTAFNGGLVLPRKQIGDLGLTQESATQAILADGRVVELETFICFIDWFGNTYETQIVANEGEFPLLGTMLLADRRLVIDYQAKTVELS